MSFSFSNLSISSKDTPLVTNVSLDCQPGEVHVIMGQNGSGKSTLANALMGHPAYTITSGTCTLDGVNILDKKVDERARLGLFLSLQYPPEIDGVGIVHFLRTAKEARTGERIAPLPFYQSLVTEAERLGLSKEVLARNVNVGFSGGEKKRLELLQLAVLKPKVIIFDEIDSGVDVDGLRVIADAVARFRSPETIVLFITHYAHILDIVVPDAVHVMAKGTFVDHGDARLAATIVANGFSSYGT